MPSPNSDLHGYRDALFELAERDDVEMIIPVREVDIYLLSKYRSTFTNHLQTPWPTFDTLNAVHDRMRLFAAAERAGVRIPRTKLLDDVTEWEREWIVKGRYAILTEDSVPSMPAGRYDSPPKTMFLEPGETPDIDAIVEKMGHLPIAQEFVDGTEYCYRALYRDGDPVATSQKELVRGYKFYRGPSIYHQAVDDPELDAAGRALLDELDWDGLASVGFLRNDAGEYHLLEVNPRVPASLPMDIHAGVDYPYYWWKLAREGSVEVLPDYRVGIASHLLRGEVVHLHSALFEENPLADPPSIPRTLWEIGTSLVEQPHFDYLSLDDPAPFVRDLLNTLGNLGPR